MAMTSSIFALNSRALLQKLTVTQLFKKYPAFYAAQRFITELTKARHWSLS
jgi:hypothetical protein